MHHQEVGQVKFWRNLDYLVGNEKLLLHILSILGSRIGESLIWGLCMLSLDVGYESLVRVNLQRLLRVCEYVLGCIMDVFGIFLLPYALLADFFIWRICTIGDSIPLNRS